jgi:hypothetical protein
MDKPIERQGQKSRNSAPKTLDKVTRKKLSEAMKEFNRKTGKVTQMSNALMQRRRIAKVPK